MVRAAAAEGRVPVGWACVAPPDPTASVNVGYVVADGYRFVPENMLVAVCAHGFRPVPFPPRS
jgi:hypothetical protein